MKLICWIINIYHLTAQHRQYQVGYRGCMNECSQRRHKKITGQGQLTYVLLGVHHPPKIPLWQVPYIQDQLQISGVDICTRCPNLTDYGIFAVYVSTQVCQKTPYKWVSHTSLDKEAVHKLCFIYFIIVLIAYMYRKTNKNVFL